MSDTKEQRPFEIGAVVVLNSGSPRMCVMGYESDRCHLSWFSDSTLHKGFVHQNCLKLVFEPECSPVDKPCPDCGTPDRNDSPKFLKRKIICTDAPRFYQQMFSEQIKDQLS